MCKAGNDSESDQDLLTPLDLVPFVEEAKVRNRYICPTMELSSAQGRHNPISEHRARRCAHKVPLFWFATLVSFE
jgi:hypothetical protein